MTDGLLIPDLTATSPSKLLSIIFLTAGVVAAILFVAYLIYCYYQEFRRNQRLRRRCRSSSATALALPAPLTFAPPKRKPSGYTVVPTIQYTVTASSAESLHEAAAELDAKLFHTAISRMS